LGTLDSFYIYAITGRVLQLFFDINFAVIMLITTAMHSNGSAVARLAAGVPLMCTAVVILRQCHGVTDSQFGAKPKTAQTVLKGLLHIAMYVPNKEAY